MKKLLFLALLFLMAGQLYAQIESAEIGINGLTCSFCTRNVEMQLRQLDFIEDVQMDLAQTNGKILFKKEKQISPVALQKAVKDAGFSIRYVYLYLNWDGENNCIEDEKVSYQFLDANQKQNGTQKAQIIAKGMLERKAFKNWETQLLQAKICSSNTEEFYFLKQLTD